MASSSVPKLYYTVIEDVIANVREAFIDEGVDEQALTELKQVWEKKLHESKAIKEETELATSKMPQAALQPLQQANPMGTSGTITHQLAMPTGNTIPLLQYTTPGSNDLQKAMQLNLNQKLTLTVPAHMAQAGLQTLVQGPSGTVQLPAEFASLFQGHNVIASTHHSGGLQHGGQQQLTGVYQALTQEQLKNAQQFTLAVPVTTQQSQSSIVGQMDGAHDTSDDDDEDDFQDNDDDRDDNDDGENEDDIGEEDEEPLNSDDDVSEDDPTDLFDTENVVVCQYDKITRSKNRWKFHLKDGIMNLQGKDFVFQKALGDSEW